MDDLTLSILGRVAERLLATMLGGMSLWAGYRLFFVASHERSNAEASGHGFVFKAERIGPGIFFALFGTVVIVYGLMTKLEFQTPSTSPSARTTSFSMGFPVQQIGKELSTEYRAINTLVLLITKMNANQDQLSGSDFLTAKRAIEVLKQIQRVYVDDSLNRAGSYDLYLNVESHCKQSTALCEEDRADETKQEIYLRVRDIVLQTME